jgi:MFS family permease
LVSRLTGIRRLLVHNRDFRRLWLAQLVSLGGDWFNTVALVGAVLDLTGSALNSGLVITAGILPQFLFAPIAGPAADRFNRRKLMVISDVARIGLALGMLGVRSPGTVWIGLVCLAGISAFSAFFLPASGASLPNLVGPDELAAANTLMSASWGTMLAVGAALGGWVASTLGRDTAFVMNAGSFAISAILILSIKSRFSSEVPKAGPAPKASMKEGVAYAKSEPRILALLVSKGGFGLGVGVVALLPVLATRTFRTGDSGIGILFAARGVGALIGPFAAGAYVGRDERRLLRALGGAMALYGVAYFAVARTPALGLAAALVMVAHLGGGAQWVLSSYGLQLLTPDRLRGRVLALDLGLVSLTISLSSLAAGRLSDIFDPRLVISVLAAVEIAYALIWLVATRRLWGPATPALQAPPASETT